ncbi:MAG: right-handed parallel beta-helix repeat-containing protein [Candidatus Thorarchaeota archaeon]|nr:right-handed parallel beta-helix repeat-containing protein [Candidatus Thorarchaeota archaeon]
MKAWSILILLILMCSSSSILTSAIPSQGINDSDYFGTYDSHVPIIITTNEDFIIQGWNGTGTLEDPFRIRELNITSDLDCISVANTTAHFTIERCLLTSETDDKYQLYPENTAVGVSLNNVTNCRIEGCYIIWKNTGISANNCSTCVFDLNVIMENWNNGFLLVEAESTNITNNLVLDNGANGIYIIESPFSNVYQNTFQGNFLYGLITVTSGYSSIKDNEFYDNDCGLVTLYSDYIEIVNNVIKGGTGGLSLTQEQYPLIVNNSIENIEGYAISLEIVNSGSFLKNFIEYNQDGIIIRKTTENNFSENTIHLNDRGITAFEASSCIFTNNTFSNIEYSIWLDQDSTDNAFYWNVLSGDWDYLAKDDGLRNMWDDNVSLGNKWGNYQGFGVYIISGSAGSVDRYPRGFRDVFVPNIIIQALFLTGISTIVILGVYYLFSKKSTFRQVVERF